MQDPFRNLNQAESNLNRLAGQARNPQAQMQAKADMIKRTINQGTANMIGALCYVTGIVTIFARGRKVWREDPTVRYHSAHARALWMIILISFCSIIGIPVALLAYMGGFYMAAEAVAGRRPYIPFLTQLLYNRRWI
jgi:uncharacterized membrane protein